MEHAICFDPSAAYTSGNQLVGLEVQPELSWQDCSQRIDDDKPVCMTDAEQYEWSRGRTINTHILYSHNFVDYAAEQDPFKRSATITRVGILKPSNAYEIDVPLIYHEATFDDELIDPIQRDDQTYGFLSTSNDLIKIEIVALDEDNTGLFEFNIKLKLNGMKRVESRVRYNYWDLLGDVGGFNDGLYLIGSLMLSTYARAAFQQDYLDGIEVESPTSETVRRIEKSEHFANTLSSFQKGKKLD